jgi:hypothetical protein
MRATAAALDHAGRAAHAAVARLIESGRDPGLLASQRGDDR